jgi:hypothetical protein
MRAAALLLTVTIGFAAADDPIRHLQGKDSEPLPDGSSGRVVEFRAADGSYTLPIYVGPRDPDPFPPSSCSTAGLPTREPPTH